eukprot:Rmarinus@m.18140
MASFCLFPLCRVILSIFNPNNKITLFKALLLYIFLWGPATAQDSTSLSLEPPNIEIYIYQFEEEYISLHLQTNAPAGQEFSAQVKSTQEAMFRVSPQRGYITAEQDANVVVYIRSLDNSPGIYPCEIEVMSADLMSNATATLKVVISDVASILKASTNSLDITCSPGSTANHSISLVNVGPSGVDWTFSSESSMILATPGFGYLRDGGAVEVTIAVSLSTTVLSDTTFKELLSFSSSPGTPLNVSLTVTAIPGAVEPGECILVSEAGTVVDEMLYMSAGEIKTIFVQSRDIAGNVRIDGSYGSYRINDSISTLELIDLGNGSVYFDLRYEAIGMYELTVLYEGIPIGSSPVTIRVSAGDIDPSECLVSTLSEACTPNLSCATSYAGDAVMFYVTFFDKFDNGIDTVSEYLNITYEAILDPLTTTGTISDEALSLRGEAALNLGDATFIVDATADGRYSVTVWVDMELTGSSPFYLDVQAKPHPDVTSSFEGDLTDMDSIIAGTTVSVELCLRDEFGNRVSGDGFTESLFLEEDGFSSSNFTYIGATSLYSVEIAFVVAKQVEIVVWYSTSPLVTHTIQVAASTAVASMSSVAAIGALTPCEVNGVCMSGVNVGWLGSEFVVTPRDQFGNIASVPASTCLYQVESMSADYCTSSADDLWSFMASSTSGGELPVRVWLAGDEISGSGFLVEFVIPSDSLPDPLYSWAVVDGVLCELGELCSSIAAGDSVTFSITLCDEFGNELDFSDKADVSLQIGDTGEKLYFTTSLLVQEITTAGTQQVRVLVSGTDVSNSWFTLDVLAGDVQSSTSVVMTSDDTVCDDSEPCISTTTEEAVSFRVFPSDAFFNSLPAYGSCFITIDGVEFQDEFTVDDQTYQPCIAETTDEESWFLVTVQRTVSATVPYEIVIVEILSTATSISIKVLVEPGRASPLSSVFSIPSETEAGTTWLVEVQAIDIYGNFLIEPSDVRFIVEVQFSTDLTPVLKLSTVEPSVGAVDSVTLSRTVADTYAVIVTLEGEAVQGSGQLITVTHAGVFDAGQSQLVAPTVLFEAGMSGTAYINPSDAYGNPLTDTYVDPSLFEASLSDGATEPGSGLVNTTMSPYMLDFISTVAGIHDVFVTYEGDPVGAGQFVIRVFPTVATASTSAVLWGGYECSDALKDDLPCARVVPHGSLAFVVELRDQYGNAVGEGSPIGWPCIVETTPVLTENATCAENPSFGMYDIGIIPEGLEFGNVTVSVRLGIPLQEVSGSGFYFSVVDVAANDTVSASNTFVTGFDENGEEMNCVVDEVCGDSVIAGEEGSYWMQQRDSEGQIAYSAHGYRCIFGLSEEPYIDTGTFYDCRDVGEGIYNIPLASTVPGTFFVFVKLDTFEVQNSGFRITVVSNEPSLATTIVVSLASLSANSDPLTICSPSMVCGRTVAAGSPLFFGVIPRDVYNNPIQSMAGVESCAFATDDSEDLILASPNSLPSEFRFEAGLTADVAGKTNVTVFLDFGSGYEHLMFYSVNVTAATLDVATCTVQGCEGLPSQCLATAGEVVHLLVHGTDEYGNGVPAIYSVTVPETQGVLEFNTSLRSDGISEFKLSLTEAGVHTVVLSYENSIATTFDVIVSVSLPEPSAIEVFPSDFSTVCTMDTVCLESIAGNDSGFLVTVKDEFGNPIPSASVFYQVVPSNSTFIYAAASAHYDDALDGYGFSLNVTTSGFYEVRVFADGIEAAEAPTLLDVLPAELQAFELDTKDLMQIMAGELVSLLLNPRDSFGNPLITSSTSEGAQDFSVTIVTYVDGDSLQPIDASDAGWIEPTASTYALMFTSESSDIFEITVEYLGFHIRTAEILVLPGDASAQWSYVVSGSHGEVCVTAATCGCASVTNTPIGYTLIILDAYNNTVYGKDDIECVFEATALGAYVSGKDTSSTAGTCDISIDAFFPADYEVTVLLDGDPVRNSGYYARFEQEGESKINGTMSQVVYSEGYTWYSPDANWTICEKAQECGPPETAAGEVVTFVLLPRTSSGEITSTVGRSICQYILFMDGFFTVDAAMANKDNALANMDGTYRIDIVVTAAVGLAYFEIHVDDALVGNHGKIPGRSESVLFYTRIVPAETSVANTEVYYGEDQCHQAVPCLDPVEVADVLLFTVKTADRYGHLRTRSSGSDAVSAYLVSDDGALSQNLNVTDGNNGEYYVNGTTTRSALYEVVILFDGEPIVGSGFLAEFTPGDPSPQNSGINYCPFSSCTCDQYSFCPEDPQIVGTSLTYYLTVRDRYDNRIEDQNAVSSLFRFQFDSPSATAAELREPTAEGADVLLVLEDSDTTGAGTYALRVYYQADTDTLLEVTNSPLYIELWPSDASAASSKIIYDPGTGKDADHYTCTSEDVNCPPYPVAAGSTLRYMVSLYDVYDNPRECNPEVSECWSEVVSVSYSVDGPEPLSYDVASRDVIGLYYFTHMLTTPAAHTLEVRLDDAVIGSSFNLTIVPDVYDASMSTVSRGNSECVRNKHCGADESLCCVTAGLEAQYSITFRDRFGNKVTDKSGMECVGRLQQMYGSKTISIPCSEDDDSTTVVVALTTAGDYLVRAIIDGSLVSNVPVLLTVSPDSIDASTTVIRDVNGVKCVADFVCGELNFPGTTASFSVIPYDKYGNQVSEPELEIHGGLEGDLHTLEFTDSRFVLEVVHTQTGEYTTVVNVDEVIRYDPVQGSGFLTAFGIPPAYLNTSVILELNSALALDNATLDAVGESFRRLLADELNVTEAALQIGDRKIIHAAEEARRSSTSYSLVVYSYTFTSYSWSMTEDLDAAVKSANVSRLADPGGYFRVYSNETVATALSEKVHGPSAKESILFALSGPDRQQCKASRYCPDSPAEVGSALTYLLQTYDEYANILYVDFGAKVAVEIYAANGSIPLSSEKCLNNLNGTYTCEVVPAFTLDVESYTLRVWLTYGSSSRVGGEDFKLDLVASSVPSLPSEAVLSDGTTLSSTSAMTMSADDTMLIDVLPRDSWENLLSSCPSNAFEAIVTNSTRHSLYQFTAIEGASICRFDLVIRRAGTYWLSITVNGDVLVKSASLSVVAGAVNASMCEVRGGGDADVVAGETTYFTVLPYDSFGNTQRLAIFTPHFRSYSGEVLGVPVVETSTHHFQYAISREYVGNLEMHVTGATGLHVNHSPFAVRAMCPAGYVHVDDSSLSGESCDVCDSSHIYCDSVNTTLYNLHSKPGSWRRSVYTYDFDECLQTGTSTYEDEEACHGHGTSCQPCIGVVGWNDTLGTDYQCARGYESRLCSLCSSGYTRSGSFECRECMDPNRNKLWIAGVLTAAGAVIGWMVRSQINDAEKDRYHSISFKIFMTYTQIISSARFLDVGWPEELEKFYALQAAVSSPSASVLSLDCQLKDDENIVFFETVKVLMMAPPFVLFLFIGVFEFQHLYLTRIKYFLYDVAAYFGKGSGSTSLRKQVVATERRAEARFAMLTGTEDLTMEEVTSVLGPRRIVAGNVRIGMIVFLFFVYPTLTMEILLLFSCEQLSDGKSYLLYSMDVECWSDVHLEMILPWGLLGIFVYVIGIPLLAFAIPYHFRHSLHHPKIFYEEKRRRINQINSYLIRTGQSDKLLHLSPDELKVETRNDRLRRYICQRRYGFLYFGYRPEYYWWESWEIFRKTLVVFITVFMSTSPVTVQGLALIAVTLMMLVVHLYTRPYEKVEVRGSRRDLLNTMELIGITVTLLSILLGMYFSGEASVTDENVRVFLTIFILGLNVGTLLYFCRSLYLAYSEAETVAGRMIRKMEKVLRQPWRETASKSVRRIKAVGRLAGSSRMTAYKVRRFRWQDTAAPTRAQRVET